MSTDGSMTRLIDELMAGGEEAAERLWEFYFDRMVRLAQRKLGSLPARADDAEDVALSAFNSFCDGARRGSFPQLNDRESLWPLLVAITAHKSIDLIRRENRKKRGGTGTAAADTGDAPDRTRSVKVLCDLREILSREPSPAMAVEAADELRRLLTLLDQTGDPDLRTIAVKKLHGEHNEEIADGLGCSRRTVERKLRLIFQTWEREIPE